MDEVATTRRRSIGGLGRAVARRPRAAIGLLLVAPVAGAWVWWATQLWGLPDVGDPFDVAAFESFHLDDDRNAFVVYREATAMAHRVWNAFRVKHPNETRVKMPQEWAKANPNWRNLLTDERPALDLWRVGSDRPDAHQIHPDGLGLQTNLDLNQRLRMMTRLAILEASRLEAEGDMAGAWGWYRAILKSSRHGGRRGFLLERLIGSVMHEDACGPLTRWAADPRVSIPLLRRVLDEVIAIDDSTPPLSDTIKREYLVFRSSMGDPLLIDALLLHREEGDPADWCQELPVPDAAKKPIQAARLLLADDRERSLRVLRLLVANWLPQVDKHPARRAGLVRADPPLYATSPGTPPASTTIDPERLARWLDSSLLASRQTGFLGRGLRRVDGERARQARLVVHLADQCYRREHGGPPPSPEALVGPYLKALPEGYDAMGPPPGSEAR